MLILASFWTAFLHDLDAFILALVGLGLLVVVGEGLHRWSRVRAADTRRIVHAGTGCAVAGFPLVFEHAAAIYILAAVFVVINGLSLVGGFLPGLHPTDRRSLGTITFPLSLLVVLPFTWDSDRVFAFQTAFLLLAVSDPLASWIGEAAPNKRKIMGTTGKTWAGSIAFYLSAVGVTLAAALSMGGWPQELTSPDVLIAVVLIVPLAGAAVEVLGGEGWDNFFLVVGITLLLVVWGEHPGWTVDILAASVGGILFAVTSTRLEYLTVSGAVAGGLFAAALMAFGGWAWAVPGLVFFLSSSILTKIRRSYSGNEEAMAGEDRRTASQVYANGGVAWIVLLVYAVYPDPLLYGAFLGAVAAASADTWASEVGCLFARNPRMITSGRKMPRGTSGAVSLAGTGAGLAAGAAIWAAAFLADGDIPGMNRPYITLMIVVGSGAAGSLADSVVGATLQGIYRDPETRQLSERPGKSRRQPILVRGWQWIDNERVNWICTAVGAAVAAGLWYAA